MKRSSLRNYLIAAFVLAVAFAYCALSPRAAAQDLNVFDDVDDIDLDLDEGLTDAEFLKDTHFSELKDWPLVASEHARWIKEDVDYRWRRTRISGQPGDRLFVKPLLTDPIINTISVPVEGSYRMWLCYVADSKDPHPVKVAMSGANELSHTFGSTRLPRVSSREIEMRLPLTFDSQIDAMSAGSKPVVVWEYVDVDLKVGDTALAISSGDESALVDAIVFARSKTFVPSKSSVEGEGNLSHTWYRYRVRDIGEVKAVNIDSFIHYMWAHHRPPSTQDIWYSSMGDFKTVNGDPDIPAGEWTAWKLSDEQTTNAGRYFSDKLTITNAENDEQLQVGIVEVQLSWLDNEHAVLRTIEVPIDEGWARYLVPVDRSFGYRSAFSTDEMPVVWGARHPDYVTKLRNEKQFLEQLLASIDPEVLKEGVMPKRIRLWTSVNTARSAWPAAVELLKKVGVNWFPRFPYEYKMEIGSPPEIQLYQQSGTVAMSSHDPMDPVYEDVLLKRNYGLEALSRYSEGDPEFFNRKHWLKMGDEIGKVTSETHVNGLPDSRARYLEYMREAAGGDPAFFGVASFDDLYYDPDRQANQSQVQRRRFYHDNKFIWWFTAQFYLRHTRAAQTHLPNVLTRCNYTPGGPMFAGDMGSSHWFALPRYNVSTAHSSEDWLAAGGYTSHAGTQTESYYGALVECGARKYNQPSDFIMVGRSGHLDRKLCMLVGSGIHSIYAYDWGPEYSRGAVDTFSQVIGAYEQLNRGMRAIGPAEDIILDGKRLPCKVAILYNRTHEIWNGGNFGVFSDRLYTYIALKHSFVNSDVLLEEDITPEILKQYDVIYVNGFNILRDTIAPLQAWVEAGGTLVAAGGTAMGDEYDDTIAEADELLGARAIPTTASKGNWMAFYIPEHEPIDTLTLKETELTPGVTVDVVGLRCVLTPTTGEVIGTYKDGSAGAVLRTLGRGKVLTYGISPGLAYSQNAPRDEAGMPTNYTADRRALVAKSALAAIGDRTIEYSEPLVDIETFEHDSGIAVILVDFTYKPGEPATLTVRTDRKIQSVTGSLRGAYEFSQNGNIVTVQCPTPDPVDVITLQ